MILGIDHLLVGYGIILVAGADVVLQYTVGVVRADLAVPDTPADKVEEAVPLHSEFQLALMTQCLTRILLRPHTV